MWGPLLYIEILYKSTKEKNPQLKKNPNHQLKINYKGFVVIDKKKKNGFVVKMVHEVDIISHFDL